MLPNGLLKEYARTLAIFIRLADTLIILFSGYLSYLLRFQYSHLAFTYLGAIFLTALMTPLIFNFFHLYEPARGKGFLSYLTSLIQAMCFLILLLSGIAFFTKSGETFSRIWFVIWMGLAFAFFILFRCGLFYCLRYMRTQGLKERRVIIIGVTELGIKLAESLQQSLWTGLGIVAFMDDEVRDKPTFINNIPVISVAHLNEYLEKQLLDEIWITLPIQAEARIKTLLHQLRHETVNRRVVFDIYGLNLSGYSISDIAGFPMVNICSTPMLGINRLLKAFEDRALAALILILITPLLIIIAFLVKLSSPGPVFYKQKRIGWNGVEFEILKFRTMPVNAELHTGPVWNKATDQRATWVGKFLRKTSLDELPQFINVLKGEMSIVGPRPERKIFVEEFKEKIPRYMQKHVVKAGITGWAQVNGWRGNTSIEKRIEYDLFYIENWSVFFDVKIIVLTLFKGFVNPHAY